jgi:hypothetical protein
MGQVGKELEEAGSSGTENPATKITPERARSILLEHGMEVNLEQAEAILSFLRRLAIISSPNFFDNESRRSVYPRVDR